MPCADLPVGLLMARVGWEGVGLLCVGPLVERMLLGGGGCGNCWRNSRRWSGALLVSRRARNWQ